MSAERSHSPENNDEFSRIIFLVKELFESGRIETAGSLRIGGLIHVMYENLNRQPHLHPNQVKEAQSLLSRFKEALRKNLASPIYYELKQIEHMLATRDRIRVV